MIKLIIEAFMLLTFLECSASSNRHRLICDTEDVNADSESTDDVTKYRGPAGPPGMPGTPAEVDYDRINKYIDAKVAMACADMKCPTTDGKGSDTKPTVEGSKCDAQGGYLLQKKCYTLPRINTSRHMSYKSAETECALHGALLAEIHDRVHQRHLRDFVFLKIPTKGKVVRLWTGMEYNRTTSTVLYRSGKTVPINQLKWYPSFPRSSPKTLVFYVGKSIEDDGLFNSASRLRQGVVCEKDM